MKIDLPVVLTPTRVEGAARCQRRHAINDILAKGKGKNVAGAFGNVMHVGVGGLHKAIEFDGLAEAGQPAYAALQAEWSKQGIAGLAEKYTIEKASTMLEAYLTGYQRVGGFEAADEWRALSIEERIRIPIKDSEGKTLFVLSFQIDRSYINKAKTKIVVVDLKTVTRPDNKWRASWYQSVQMKLYAWGCKQVYGIDDVQFVIEGLDKNAKPKLHYVMLPQWSDAMLNETLQLFIKKAAADEKILLSALDSDGNVDIFKLEDAVLNDTEFNRHDCESYGQTCAYLPLCNAEPEQRRGLLHAEYEGIEADY